MNPMVVTKSDNLNLQLNQITTETITLKDSERELKTDVVHYEANTLFKSIIIILLIPRIHKQ